MLLANKVSQMFHFCMIQEVSLHMYICAVHMHTVFSQFISFSAFSCSWLNFVRSYVAV